MSTDDTDLEVDDAIERMGSKHTARAVAALLVEIKNGDVSAAERILRIANYARRKYLAQVEDILDDPSFLLHPDEDAVEYLADLTKDGAALGLDLRQVIESTGTEFERRRLLDIIHRTTG